MKLSRAETAAIAITFIFLVFTAVYLLHAGRSGAAAAVSVGRMAETTASPAPPNAEAKAAAAVNLNTADKEALDTLPGIGESLAEAIIAYRTENGAFRTEADLMRVPGIGAKTYEALKALITVG